MMDVTLHRVKYYETDKMGIVHHSNYIRWMEEARTDFLNRLGCGVKQFEACGITSPVVSLSCRYLASATFDDEIAVRVFLEAYTGVRLSFGYVMTHNGTGTKVLTANSSHCLINAAGRPVSVKKYFPALDMALKRLAEKKKEQEG